MIGLKIWCWNLEPAVNDNQQLVVTVIPQQIAMSGAVSAADSKVNERIREDCFKFVDPTMRNRWMNEWGWEQRCLFIIFPTIWCSLIRDVVCLYPGGEMTFFNHGDVRNDEHDDVLLWRGWLMMSYGWEWWRLDRATLPQASPALNSQSRGITRIQVHELVWIMCWYISMLLLSPYFSFRSSAICQPFVLFCLITWDCRL